MQRRTVLFLAMAWTLGGSPIASAPAATGATARNLAPGRVEIDVEDLHCASCAKKVARKLYAVKGVRKVSTSLKNDLVVVFLPAKQPVPAARLWAAVEASGIPPVELRFGTQRLDAEAMKPLLAAAKPGAVAR